MQEWPEPDLKPISVSHSPATECRQGLGNRLVTQSEMRSMGLFATSGKEQSKEPTEECDTVV